MNKQKTYLVEALIVDGDHEHRNFALIRAYDLNEAEVKSEKKSDYFLYDDGLADVKKLAVTVISDSQASLIQRLRMAYYM